jgi:hypothetical protein
MRRCTTRAVPAGRALLRAGGPSATPRPRASYYGRGITSSSPLVGLPPPLFKRSPLLLAPPDLAPAVPPRRRGRRLASRRLASPLRHHARE